MFFVDGVAIFWFILGFHLFNNKDYFILIKKVFKAIYIKFFSLAFIFMLYNNFFLDKPLFPTFEDFKKAFFNSFNF